MKDVGSGRTRRLSSLTFWEWFSLEGLFGVRVSTVLLDDSGRVPVSLLQLPISTYSPRFLDVDLGVTDRSLSFVCSSIRKAFSPKDSVL